MNFGILTWNADQKAPLTFGYKCSRCDVTSTLPITVRNQPWNKANNRQGRAMAERNKPPKTHGALD